MSDAPETTTEEAPEPSVLDAWAEGLTQRLGADGYSVDFDTVRIAVSPESWVETILEARNELPFFSWLSAIDWSKDYEVGEGVDDPDSLEERFEVLCRLSSVETADGAIFVTTLSHDEPAIDSLAPHIGGANWHEREAHEMFGIDFKGHPHLVPLYLPDDFVGNPLLKTYPLLSREVKPWPGEVDVEEMPPVEEAEGDGS